MDLHVVSDAHVLGQCREEGRITMSARRLEREPERLYGLRLRDAFLHVPVSDELLTVIRMRVGRAGSPGRHEGGNIWQPVPRPRALSPCNQNGVVQG